MMLGRDALCFGNIFLPGGCGGSAFSLELDPGNRPEIAGIVYPVLRQTTRPLTKVTVSRA